MRLKSVHISLIALLLSGFALFASIYSFNHSKIVIFDEKGTIQAFVRQLSLKQASTETSQKLSQKFKVNLKQALAEYSDSHSVVILKPQDVVMGAIDITPVIQSRIAIKMAGKRK